nr:hypothetical protein [Tanacetum cinerariifolium]
MQDTDEAEPDKVEEVIEVVTAAKLMTEVVTTATTPITDAQVPKASAPRKRRGAREFYLKSLNLSKKQAQIEQDKAFARELEAKLNANINWNDVLDQVKRKEKQENTVMRYQALKRKPVTEAQARKNMMVYLKNMAGFKMDFFGGMTYNEIRPIFKKHYILNQDFLERVEEERIFGDALEACLRKIQSSKPNNFLDDFLLNTLKTMFEKPNVEASIWRNQRGRYGLAKVKSWKLFKSHGVYILTLTTTQMILLVEKKYPLTRFTLEQMLNNVRHKVEEESEMSLELLRLSGGDVFDLIGDVDPTDEDGDIRMGDSTGVSASLGGEISSGGKKSRESNSDNTLGIIVGEAIRACNGGICNSLVASYACMTSIYGSLCKGEKTSVAKRYLVKSFEEPGEVFPDEAGK